MRLVPREVEKLMIFTAARMAERRRQDGVKLNYPESIAMLADFIQERARRGDTIAKITRDARHILTLEDVMPGVAEMMTLVQVEATFQDGTKLVSIHNPIQPKEGTVIGPSRTVGHITLGEGDIVTFPNRNRISIKVKNTGDRAIQVGSHFHFFESNRVLDFEREKAYGMKLDIPSGTSIRFEPGQEKEVTLVEFGGKRYAHGFNNLVDGSVRTPHKKVLALEKAKKLKFKGA